MLHEVIGLVGVLVVLTLIGLGPATYAGIQGPQRLTLAIGLAPAIGYGLIGLLGFPLARWLAPAQVWAWPLTLLLLAGSGGLLARQWRQYAPALTRGDWARLGLGTGFTLAGVLVLARPVLQAGMQFAAFRHNPSDAFLYTSLAESLHSVDWHRLVNGSALTQSNWAGLQALADASPTAIFTARFVDWPLALNKMGLQAWAAVVAFTPVYRFYYAHHLLALAVALPASLTLGGLLRLPRLLKIATAGAVALGYWANFLLESDAGYEISAVPLLLLAVIGWMLVEAAPERMLSGGRTMLALGVAGLIAFYFPMGVVLAAAAALYYLGGLAQGVSTWRILAAHGVTVALSVGLLAATGQLDFVARSVINLISRADGERAFQPVVLDALRRDGLAGLWGYSAGVLTTALPGRLRWPVEQGLHLIGAFLAAAWLTATAGAVRREAPRPERVMAAMCLGGLAVAGGLLVISDNERSAGKALTYIFPYLFLGTATATHHFQRVLRPGWQGAAQAGLAAAFGLQGILGLVWPQFALAPRLTPAAPTRWHFDLGPIEQYLSEHPPAQLVVSVPRNESLPFPDSWVFAYYTMLALARFQPYFQSGVVTDNSTTAPNLWLQAAPETPDYAVVLREQDDLARLGLGQAVAETPDLILYRVTAAEASVLADGERLLQAAEALKGPLQP